jgi:hypothetical protein
MASQIPFRGDLRRSASGGTLSFMKHLTNSQVDALMAGLNRR